MKTLIKSSYNCLVKTNSQILELDKNDILEVENEKYVFVYPENRNVSFYINLASEKENQFYSVIKQPDKSIYFLEPQKHFTVCDSHTLNINGTTCQIFTTNQDITFQTPTKKITHVFDKNHDDFKIFKHKSFACVQYDNDLYAFSVPKNKLFHLQADSIVVNDSVVTTIKKYHDSVDREKTVEYKLEENFSVENENQISKPNKTPQELLPYQFLESIKAHDYAFAKNCLSKDLKIGEEQLMKFFGNILQFLPINENEYITISTNGKSYVTFALNKNIITDISVDNI